MYNGQIHMGDLEHACKLHARYIFVSRIIAPNLGYIAIGM